MLLVASPRAAPSVLASVAPPALVAGAVPVVLAGAVNPVAVNPVAVSPVKTVIQNGIPATPSPRARSASLSSIGSAGSALPLFEGIAPPRAPTTVKDEEDLIPVPGLPGVRLKVDAGPGCGGIAWPSGEVLSRYIAYRYSVAPQTLAGKTLLELGSGTGLVGLAAAMLEPTADVYVTDQKILLDLMEANAELNMPGPERNLHVAELNWGDDLPADVPHKVDIVLAADCVYFEPAFPLLVKTLCDLAPVDDQPEILFCWKKRRKADKRFFALLKRHFDSEIVMDDKPGEKERYNREGVTLLRLHRKGGKKTAKSQ